MRAPARRALQVGFTAVSLVAAACGGTPEDAEQKQVVSQVEEPLWSRPSFEVDSMVVQQGYWHHFGPFSVVGPYGTTNPVFEARLGPVDADVDLYVRKGARPTLSAYDCRPYYGGTSVESCTTGPSESGTYYVSVYGYRTGKYGLRIYNSSNLGLSSVALRGESLRQGDWAFYGPFGINAGRSSGAWLTTTAGDADLYVTSAPSTETYYYTLYWPTLTRYDCRPYFGGTLPESCATAAPKQQIVGVRGWAAGVSTYDIDVHEY